MVHGEGEGHVRKCKVFDERILASGETTGDESEALGTTLLR